MTSLLVFLKIIGYIISIPVVAIATLFIYILLFSLKVMYIDSKSKYYAIGYVKGSFGLPLHDSDYTFCKNDTNYSDCIKGHGDGKCKKN